MSTKSKLFCCLLPVLLLAVGCTKTEEQAPEPVTKTGVTEGIVEVEGAKLRYVMEGSGIPCLMIGASAYYPKAFSQELRQHFTMVFMDLRTFGIVDPEYPLADVTLDTYLDDIETVRSELNLGKVCIMGHSITGLIALEYARKYPQNTSHAVVIGMAPAGMQEMAKALAEFWASDASEERKTLLKENFKKRGKEIAALPPYEQLVQNYVTRAPMYWYDPTYDCSWLWEGTSGSMDQFNQLFSIIFADYAGKDTLEAISTPVFVAVGRYDYVVPYTLWEEAKKKLPNLSFHLFEKSGHTPQLEEQAFFDQKLLEWIKSN